MKTIRTADKDQNKIVKKILIKRSLLNSQSSSSLKKDNMSNSSPVKYLSKKLDLKNGQEYEGLPQQFVLNAQQQYCLDSFSAMKQPKWCQRNGKINQKQFHVLPKKSMDLTIYPKKNSEVDECISESKCPSEKDTSNSQKNSGRASLKIESGYFEVDYQSPSMKLKKLQKQRSCHKQQWLNNLEKVIEVEEKIKQDRHRNQLEVRLFEQIIKNLQKQERSSKFQSLIFENNNSSMKLFGNEDTTGDSESLKLPYLTHSCQL